MLFFSEDGILMYSDGRNCIELFDNMKDKLKDHYSKLGIKVHTGESLNRDRSSKVDKNGIFYSPKRTKMVNNSEDEEMSDDEFAAIEPAGVDKNGKSLGNHGIRADASKSTGKVFRTLGGKTMVHSYDD